MSKAKPRNKHTATKHNVNGEMLTVAEACAIYGKDRSIVYNTMYRKKISLQEALEYVPNDRYGNKEWHKLKDD